MATWLYVASSNFASAKTTYDLAYSHGIVWRTYYANRRPAEAIPNVGALAPGDEIYLGYRHNGHVRLVGRMRLGRPDLPLTISPVFVAVPQALLPHFTSEGYSSDPVLNEMVGLFVEEVEPIDGIVPSPGRLTITKSSSNLGQQSPPLTEYRSTSSNDPPKTLSLARVTPLVPAAREAQRAMFIPNHRSFVGIDVAGRSIKGYDLCNLVWSDGQPVLIRFARLPHAIPLPPTDDLRQSVAQGDVAKLADLTHTSAAATAAALWARMVQFADSTPTGVFIDSPSAFSRNAAGHGRLTEKQSISGVSFQSTPSFCCNREHGADWGWLLYGMVAFAACLHRGPFTLAQWTEALATGLSEPTLKAEIVVRECFPTATISHLRTKAKAALVKQLLSSLQTNEAERQAVLAYLDHGVHGVKEPRHSLFDRADALVAALSSLPYAREDFAETLVTPMPDSTRWRAGVRDAGLIEGSIALPG